MSRITGNPLSSAFATKAVKVDTPAEALKRLDLRGPASTAWEDVVRLDATGVQRVARAIDDERLALQDAYEGGVRADAALKEIDEFLTEIDALAAANGKSGVARRTRRENQSKIDALLEKIRTRAEDVKSPAGERLLDGEGKLKAGVAARKPEALELERAAPDAMGKVVVDGRTLTLADVARRKPLDTSEGRRSNVADARRAVEVAKKSVAAMRERIQAFQKDELRPRLGDVATAMEGIYTSTGLGSGEEALKLARELRTMTLQSATLAVALGADGWDRERTFELLT